MRKLLVIAGLALFSISAHSAEVADQVTFKMADTAPSGFTFWTFHWSMPEVDADATLQYVVLQPDGKEYFRYTIGGERQTGQSIRSDFSKSFAGGDPKVFYGENITFKFTVDKGKIKFPENPPFRFEFKYTVKAIKQ
jgi:hypothetical protein